MTAVGTLLVTTLTGCLVGGTEGDEATSSNGIANKHVQAGKLWVANRIPGSIDVFDTRTGERIGSTRTGNGTIDVALPEGLGKIYGSDESSGTISVVDTATLVRTAVITIAAGTKPHHMDSNPDGSLIYASEFGTNKLVAVDTATDTIAWQVELGPTTAFVHGTMISRDGGTLWVTNGAAGTYFSINELDAHTGEVRRSQQVNFDWSEITYDKFEQRLFASDKTTNSIRVFDAATLEQLGAVSVPQTPDTMSLSQDGDTLLVGLRGFPSTCVFIDLPTLTATPLQLSNQPGTSTGHHTLSANGKWAFISMDGVNAPPQIAVLDMETHTVFDRWNDPGRPHGMVFQPDDTIVEP